MSMIAEGDLYYSFGLMGGQNGKCTGNGVMFTVEWIAALRDKRMPFAIAERDFRRVLVLRLQREPGYYLRNEIQAPFASDVMLWDDYVALAAWSATNDRAYAEDILHYGRNHYYQIVGLKFPGHFDAFDPKNFKAWFFKSPPIYCHFQWCAGERPWFFFRWIWALAIATTALFKSGAQDEWRFSWHMVNAAPAGVPFGPVEIAKWIWKVRFRKAWPGGMRVLRAVYFNDAKHPLSVYAPEV